MRPGLQSRHCLQDHVIRKLDSFETFDPLDPYMMANSFSGIHTGKDKILAGLGTLLIKNDKPGKD